MQLQASFLPTAATQLLTSQFTASALASLGATYGTPSAYSPAALANVPVGTAYVCALTLDCGSAGPSPGDSSSGGINALALGLGIGLGVGLLLLAVAAYFTYRACNERHVAQAVRDKMPYALGAHPLEPSPFTASMVQHQQQQPGFMTAPPSGYTQQYNQQYAQYMQGGSQAASLNASMASMALAGGLQQPQQSFGPPSSLQQQQQQQSYGSPPSALHPLTPAGLALLSLQQQQFVNRTGSLPNPHHLPPPQLYPSPSAAAAASVAGSSSTWQQTPPIYPGGGGAPTTIAHIATNAPSLNLSFASSAMAAPRSVSGVAVAYPLTAFRPDGAAGSPYAQGNVGSSYTGVPVPTPSAGGVQYSAGSGGGGYGGGSSALMSSSSSLLQRRHSHGSGAESVLSAVQQQQGGGGTPRRTTAGEALHPPAPPPQRAKSLLHSEGGSAPQPAAAAQPRSNSLLRQAQANNSILHGHSAQGQGGASPPTSTILSHGYSVQQGQGGGASPPTSGEVGAAPRPPRPPSQLQPEPLAQHLPAPRW